jgi:hypothetical protein
MSSSVYIPSTSGGGSASPTSVSVKTASYTVPSGKYGLVTVLNRPVTGTTFSLAANTSGTKSVTEAESMLFINGVSAVSLPYLIQTVITVVSNATARDAAVVMPDNYGIGLVSIKQTGATGGSASGSVSIGYKVGASTAVFNSSVVGNGNYANQNYANNLVGTYTSTAAILFTPIFSVPNSFWVKSGDVITIPSSGSFIFSEYTI